ncbi:GntR family transcriptional regulator [Stappia sp. WLB 29]|uniref:GntR family transcriptional regulator n=1 Tax=Stappia sp. WLB 29 TaxID=2925220 RepID=UPI0020BEB6BF|nr:GntR family transcriptional regulator [Stappia sp. WLB 29]
MPMELIDQSPILVDRVYERLRQAIALAELAPGERIRQAELAERLGVSRQPVSHALQLLKRDGLVEETGRKGLKVTEIDPAHLREIYQVRAALDGLAAGLAAARVAEGSMPEAELEKLAGILRQAESFGDDTPVTERIALDVDFHNQVIVMSGNRRIAETLEPQFSHMMRSMRLVLDIGGFRESAWDHHTEIARLIAAGDRAAEDAARAHAENAGKETEARLTARQVLKNTA